MRYVDWQPVNITLDCLYRVDPPDDEQQACAKHVEAYHWNKLIENSASCWFILYGYITMHGQQNFKFITYRFIQLLVSKLGLALSFYLHSRSLKSSQYEGYGVLWNRIVWWMDTKISEEHSTSIFRASFFTLKTEGASFYESILPHTKLHCVTSQDAIIFMFSSCYISQDIHIV